MDMEIIIKMLKKNRTLTSISLFSQNYNLDAKKLLTRSFLHDEDNNDKFEFEVEEIDQIIFLLQSNLTWEPNIHRFLDYHFQHSVFAFLLCLKRLSIKVPSQILFEIIKRIDRKNFKVNFEDDSSVSSIESEDSEN